MDTKLLKEIGLTEGETKVYLALLELGLTTTGALVKKSGVSASKVYLILDRLAKKGLVGHVMKGGIRYFQATDPRRILDYMTEQENELAEKKQEVLALLPQLMMKQKLGTEKRRAEIYEGFKGVTNLFTGMIDDLKSGEAYYTMGVGYGFEEIRGMRAFFTKYHAERARRRIKVFMLANYSVKDILVPTTQLRSEVKFLPEELITNVQITVYKDRTFIILWSNDPIAFLIHNAEIASGFMNYFNLLWKRAERAS